MKVSNNIIVKPLISEKSVKEAQSGKYTFIVVKDANKYEIASAVEALFKVKVIGVATNIVKEMKFRTTKFGKSKTDLSYKKARVRLASGQKIQIFEGEEK